MLWLVTHSFLVFFAVAIQAEDSAALISQAAAAYEAQDYARAAKLYEAAIEAGPAALSSAYNAACCYARLGRADDAFTRLAKALDAGWRDVERLKADAAFESLHADHRWDLAVQRCQSEMDKYTRSLKGPALREELLKRMNEDQRIRMAAKPGLLEWKKMREWRKIDADNTAFMKTVIEKYGWPGKSMVRDDGAVAAWLLVQHADADVAFQKQCLELLKKAVQQAEASADHLAYLTDRVLVADGKPQRYGTQFHTVNGEQRPLPIEDEANVDARRKDVGLPPMAEYVEQMREMERP